MKRFLWFSAFILVISGATAQTGASPKAAPKKSTSSARVSAKDVQELRDALAAQQKQAEEQRQQLDQVRSQLQQLLDATQQTSASAQKVQGSAEQAQTTASQAQQSATEAQRLANQASTSATEAKTALALVDKKSKEDGKKLSALQDVLGRFRFTGDVRVRGEDFFQDCPACVTRNRARIRVRFGVDGKLSEDFTGGILLTSGSLGDSNSTNETLTNFFTRKTIGIDRAYVTYQPVAHSWISLTGGKFAYTWQRTSTTFDPDLNPEGFSEEFSFDLKSPIIKNFTIQGIQLLYGEVNRGNDSFVVGGQVSSKLDFGFMTSNASFSLLDWRFPDAILNASGFAVQASPGEGPGCATGSGLPATPPCVYGPQGFTNATFTDAAGRIHFLSGFAYADFILNNQIKTGWSRFPINLMLEYENNLNAADHPLDSQGNILTDLGKQSHVYLVDFSLGQLKNRNDLQIGYGWWRQEQDSAISSFLESETRAPSNILQNRIYALWKVRSNTVASYNLWIGRTLNSSLQHAILAPGITAGQQEPYLKRMQFDLIYSF
jgi:hypothetical protein